MKTKLQARIAEIKKRVEEYHKHKKWSLYILSWRSRCRPGAEISCLERSRISACFARSEKV